LKVSIVYDPRSASKGLVFYVAVGAGVLVLLDVE